MVERSVLWTDAPRAVPKAASLAARTAAPMVERKETAMAVTSEAR
jgi:hypothetical protein